MRNRRIAKWCETSSPGFRGTHYLPSCYDRAVYSSLHGHDARAVCVNSSDIKSDSHKVKSDIPSAAAGGQAHLKSYGGPHRLANVLHKGTVTSAIYINSPVHKLNASAFADALYVFSECRNIV